MRRVVAILGLALAIAVPALATMETAVHDYTYRISVRNEVPGIRVDYARQAVIITTVAHAPVQQMGGNARTTARALALTDAKKSVSAAFGATRLTAYATVNEMLLTGYLPTDSTAQIGANIRPIAEGWDTDQRTIKLVSAMPLTGANSPGELAARMLKIEQDAFPKQVCPRSHAPMDAILHPSKTPVKQLSDGPYTGVILDCAGLNYTPVLLPKLVSKDGTELWGMLGVNPQLVMEKGLTGYAATLKEAVASLRAGAKPYVIRPLGTCGPLQGDLVLSDEDAKQLAELQTATNCLSTLSVVISLE